MSKEDNLSAGPSSPPHSLLKLFLGQTDFSRLYQGSDSGSQGMVFNSTRHLFLFIVKACPQLIADLKKKKQNNTKTQQPVAGCNWANHGCLG